MGTMQTKAGDDKATKREEIQAQDARARLGELIDRAGFLGERIIITRNGKPLVALIGMEDLAALDAA